MKIIDRPNLQGWQVKIPDCGRDNLPEFFKEMGSKVVTEIGVYKGVTRGHFAPQGEKRAFLVLV